MGRALLLIVFLSLAPQGPALAGAAPPGCLEPLDGLVSWWPGEGSAEDAQGSNDGTLQNGAGFAAGVVGQGLSFDGVDDFVTVADDPSLEPAKFTISAWVSSPGVTNAFAAFIAARSGPAGSLGYELAVNPPALGETVRFVLNGGAQGADLSGTTDVADGQFHHVAATFDGAGMRIYVDGVLESSNSFGFGIDHADGPLVIGRREGLPNGVPEVWNGVIDELQLYTGRALCAAEIAAIAQAGAAGFCGGGIVPICLDPFLCYKAKTTKGTAAFAPQEVALADPLEMADATLKKALAICRPSELDAGDPYDRDAQLEAYQIKSALPHAKQSQIEVTTAFGTLSLDTVKPDQLLVPTSLGEGGVPGALTDSRVDPFKCYKVKVTKGTPKLPKGVQASVENFFDTARTFDVKKPKRLCLAADQDGAGIAQPGARLLCYQAKPAKGEAKHVKRTGVFVLNPFGQAQLDTVKETELCVPELPPAP
jgi:hypothetical protein